MLFPTFLLIVGMWMAYYDPNPDAEGKMYVKQGGFLDHVDQFDPLFFGMSPKEAIALDPQQRLLLEVSWEALENAGIRPSSLKNTLGGVFIGIWNNDYLSLIRQSAQSHDTHLISGNVLSTAAGRVSYTFGMQGPSMSIDTACSSSLVTIHEACYSLQRGECNFALAGGVNLILTPDYSINFCNSTLLSPDGRCKTFDEKADGLVRSEGCGIVVLKLLKDALHDGDPIMAIIKGSAVNQDGPSAGLTVPNTLAQKALLKTALQEAHLEPKDIDYLEAHGTGTNLGDPIEVEALNVLGGNREHPLLLGAVKTNIGHTETAAGVASLLKVVLALQREVIPKNLHFHHLNPHIDLSPIPAEVVVNNYPWKRDNHIRRGGVSAFGFRGTNAHVIVEEAPFFAEKKKSDGTTLPSHYAFGQNRACPERTY